MNDLVITTGTISTIELRDIVNEARKQAGENNIQNTDFLARVEDELGDEIEGQKFSDLAPRTKTPMAAYRLTHDQAMLVGMRESKSVRRKVLEKLKALEKPQLPAMPQDFAAALRLAADQQEKITQLALANQQQATRIDTLESLLAKGMSAPEFCRHLNGVNTMAINKFLLAAGWLFEDGGQYANWRVASYARDRYMTERPVELSGSKGAFTVSKPVLLAKGARWLLSKYVDGKLPMKRNWDGERKHDLRGVLEVVA